MVKLAMPSSPAPPKSRHKQKVSRQGSDLSSGLFKTINASISAASIPKETGHSTVPVGNVRPPPKPQNWPNTISYLKRPIVSPHLTEKQRRWLQQKPSITHAYSDLSSDVNRGAETAVPVIKLPALDVAERIEIRSIQDKAHPTHGQHGLFAIRDLSPGTFVLPYFGYVHSSSTSERNEFERQKLEREASEAAEIRSSTGIEDTAEQQIGSWDRSDYDLNLYRDEEIELAVDAALMGNEARFCNDYRGVPASVDSVAAANEHSWNRKAKRAAKTQSFDNDLSSASMAGQTWRDHDVAVAIPNAEFRDVWLEWNTSEGEECKNENVYGVQIDGALDEGMQQMRVDRATGAERDTACTEVRGSSETCHSRPSRKRRKEKTGIRGVAIFVLPAGKSGKRKNGIRAGQEILVSYGKGFWAYHTS